MQGENGPHYAQKDDLGSFVLLDVTKFCVLVPPDRDHQDVTGKEIEIEEGGTGWGPHLDRAVKKKEEQEIFKAFSVLIILVAIEWLLRHFRTQNYYFIIFLKFWS